MHKFHIDCAKFLYQSNDQNQFLANTENLISKHSLYLILTMHVQSFLTMHVRNFKIRSTSNPRRNTRGMFRTRNTNIAWNFFPWCLRTLLSYLQQCIQFSQSPLETSTLFGLLFLRDWLCQLVMWLLEVYSISIFLFYIYVLHGNKELILFVVLSMYASIYRI